MRFTTFIVKNLVRRKVRSALTIGGVAVAVGAVVALVGISNGFTRSLEEVYNRRGVDLLVLQTGARFRSQLDQSLAEKIAHVPGVRGVGYGLVDLVPTKEYEQGVTIQGWVPGTAPFNDLQLLNGRFLRTDDQHAVMLGEKVAEHLKKKAGDTITLPYDDYAQRFEVVGVFHSFSIYENSSIILPLTKLQELTETAGRFMLTDRSLADLRNAGVPETTLSQLSALKDKEFDQAQLLGKLTTILGDDGRARYQELFLNHAMLSSPKVSGFQVFVNDPADREGIQQIAKQIEGLGKRISASPTPEYISNTMQLQIANGMAWMTSIIALIIGVIGILNTMIMSVFERTREIGILRALGWRKLRIVCMILAESVVLSIGGAALGILGALAMTNILTRIPPVNGYIRGDVAPVVLLEGVLIALAVGLIGGAYPAYRGAKLLPTEAIRHE